MTSGFVPKSFPSASPGKLCLSSKVMHSAGTLIDLTFSSMSVTWKSSVWSVALGSSIASQFTTIRL